MHRHVHTIASGLIVLALTAGAHAGLDDELIGYWPFEGTYEDISGSGNHSLGSGTSFVAGQFGQGVEFGASGDYVEVPFSSSLAFSGDFTFSFYTNFVKTTGSFDAFLEIPQRQFQIYTQHYDNRGLTVYGSGTHYVAGYPTIGDWTHVAVTVSPTSSKTYFDGQLVYTYSRDMTMTNDTKVFFGYNPSIGGWLDGSMDDVALWDRALSGTEVQAVADGGLVDLFSGPNPGGNNLTIGALPSEHVEGEPNYVSNGTSASLNVADLTGALAGGNATVTTGNGGSNDEPGDLNVDAAIDFDAAGTTALSLHAVNDIIINAPVHDTIPGGDALALTLRGDYAEGQDGGSPAGEGDVLVNAAIDLAGGTLAAGGVHFHADAPIAAAAAHLHMDGNVSIADAMTLTGTLDANGVDFTNAGGPLSASDVTLAFTRDVHIAAPLNAVGSVQLGAERNLTLETDLNPADITLAADAIDTANAAITASGTIAVAATVTADLGDLAAPTIDLGDSNRVNIRGTVTGDLDFTHVADLHIGPGGTLDVQTFTQTGNSVTLDGGTLSMTTADITGGTFSFAGGDLVIKQDADLSNPALAPLLSGPLSAGQTLTVQGSLTAAANTVLDGGTITSSAMLLGGGQTLTGHGVVQAEFVGARDSAIAVDAGRNLLIGHAGSAQGFRTDGTLTVNASSGLTLQSLNFAELGKLTVLQGGTIEAVNGATLGVGDAIVGHGEISGSLVAASGSTILAEGLLQIGNGSAADGVAISGRLYVNDQTVILLDLNRTGLGFGSLTDLGDAGTGVLRTFNGLDIDQNASVMGYGTIDTPDNEAAPLVNNGSLAGLSPSMPITLNGYVMGRGSFENFMINGTYSPGLSAARVRAEGMALSDDAVLLLELYGPEAGGEYDQLWSDAVLSLNGTLEVVLREGYVPELGTTFELFDGPVSGSFDRVLLPEAVQWDTTALLTEGTIVVVPEPGTLAVAALGMLAAVLRRRR